MTYIRHLVSRSYENSNSDMYCHSSSAVPTSLSTLAWKEETPSEPVLILCKLKLIPNDRNLLCKYKQYMFNNIIICSRKDTKLTSLLIILYSTFACFPTLYTSAANTLICSRYSHQKLLNSFFKIVLRFLVLITIQTKLLALGDAKWWVYGKRNSLHYSILQKHTVSK